MSILLKRNNTSGVAPAPEELVPGEIAINTVDASLYTKTESGDVILLASAADLPPPTVISWSNVTGKPSSFTPSAHTHSPSDITGTAVITTDPRLSDNRDPNPHSHDWYSLDITNKPLIDNNGDNWRFVAPAQAGSVELISHSANYFVRVSEGGPAQTIGTLVKGPITILNSGSTGINGSITFPDSTTQTTAYTGLVAHTHPTSDITGLDSSISDIQTDISNLETGKQDAGDYALADHQHNKINENTSIGLNSLSSITTGARNTGLGYDTLVNITSGINNTGIGAPALYSTIDGENNTSIGAWSCFFTTSGSENTAVGVAALLQNVNGNGNIAFGGASLANNTTGINNTSIGTYSGDTNTTGSSNIFVGFGATALSNNLNNCIVLGANAVANTSGELVIGSSTSAVNTALSVGTTGSAAALPDNPLGYLQLRLNGTLVKIPYYRA